MNEKKQPTEYPAEPVVESSYQTGSTNPPKSHAGLVSFLLGLVIFFCGISTLLSLMRINLLQALTHQAQTQECTMSFTAATQAAPLSKSDPVLGIEGQPVPAFWQHYHSLPQGLYITRTNSSHIFRTGDILLQLGSTPVLDWESLQLLTESYNDGDTVIVTVYRDGNYRQMYLTIHK